MGAWAKDPVPGAAAGAVLVARRAVSGARRDVGSSPGASPRGGARHRVFRPCAHGPWPLVVYYYIITPLFYIIILFYVFSTVSEFVRICQNLSEFVRICQNLLELVRICQNLSDFVRFYQNLSEFVRICQNIYKNILKYIEIY